MFYVSVIVGDVAAGKCHQNGCGHWVKMLLLCDTGLGMHFHHSISITFVDIVKYHM